MVFLKKLFQKLLNLLISPSCLHCGSVNVSTMGLCQSCWTQLRFIGNPHCFQCSLPLPVGIEENYLCSRCYEQKPSYDKAYAIFEYTSVGKKLVLSFKNQDRTELKNLFLPWLMKGGQNFFKEADVIIPIPLHWTRLFLRKYNQAAILAHLISRNINISYNPFILKRRYTSYKQKNLTRQKRFKHIEKVFYVPEKQKKSIENKVVLLVDDVITTGATIHAAAHQLKKNGAQKVYVLALARVVLQS
jgi:ComF family protein